MQIHRIVLGLDVLGNPVNVVRGVVEGTFDLFYEPIKVMCMCHTLLSSFCSVSVAVCVCFWCWCVFAFGVCLMIIFGVQGSVLGPQEFAEGLGIGLRSFVGGTFGDCTHTNTT